jgi:hypothetical protein
MLAFHLYVGHLHGLIPLGLPNKILYAFLFSATHATCPALKLLGRCCCSQGGGWESV